MLSAAPPRMTLRGRARFRHGPVRGWAAGEYRLRCEMPSLSIEDTEGRGVAKGAGMCDGVRMDIITCPECGAHDQAVRDGHNRSGSQRYRCRMCRRAFTPSPKEQGHDPTTHEQAVRLYLEGMSLRATGRILGVVHQSVANWVAEAAAHLPTAVSDATPSETVEVDELYTFVERKKGRPSS